MNIDEKKAPHQGYACNMMADANGNFCWIFLMVLVSRDEEKALAPHYYFILRKKDVLKLYTSF